MLYSYTETHNILTHWPLKNQAVIFKKMSFFQCLSRCDCPIVNATRSHWWLVNIGSDNGLVPSGTKPLLEPMVTQIYMASLGNRKLTLESPQDINTWNITRFCGISAALLDVIWFILNQWEPEKLESKHVKIFSKLLAQTQTQTHTHTHCLSLTNALLTHRKKKNVSFL